MAASASTVVQWSNHKGQKFEQRNLLLDADGTLTVTRGIVDTPDVCLQLYGCAINVNNMILNCVHVQVTSRH